MKIWDSVAAHCELTAMEQLQDVFLYCYILHYFTLFENTLAGPVERTIRVCSDCFCPRIIMAKKDKKNIQNIAIMILWRNLE